MRILFLVNSIARQGTYFRWHNLARGLRELGHAVTVSAFDHTSTAGGERVESRDGIEYRILPGSRGQRWLSQESHPAAALRGCARTGGPADIMHVFQPFLTSALPWLVRGRALARVAVYDWDDLWAGGLLRDIPASASARWMRRSTSWLERELPRRASHVTVCSPWLAALARERGARDTTQIPNGYWPALHPTKAEARRTLGLRTDVPYFGFMGRTITGAELDWLAASLRVLASSNCRLAVCGVPPDLLRPRLGAGREALDILGQLTPEECRGFAAAIDVGLLPLENAPLNQARFPIKFADYLSAGCPVLISRVGPCAAIGRDWPFVLAAEPTAEGWLAAVRHACELAGSSTLPTVNQAVVLQLAWSCSASRLENLYARLLRRGDTADTDSAEDRQVRCA